MTSVSLAPLASVPAADGAFYILLRVNTTADPLVIGERLVREHKVAVIPGTAFGMTDGCYFRVAFGALQRATVAEGIGHLHAIDKPLVDFFAGKAIGVTTNVIGPKQPRYLTGVEVTGVLGWVPGSGGQTLGVSIFSYADTVRIGFKVDATVVPEPDRLVAFFEEEIDTLRDAAGTR